jgi:hypothetical protein
MLLAAVISGRKGLVPAGPLSVERHRNVKAENRSSGMWGQGISGETTERPTSNVQRSTSNIEDIISFEKEKRKRVFQSGFSGNYI